MKAATAVREPWKVKRRDKRQWREAFRARRDGTSGARAGRREGARGR